jgi:hypothetical protein
MFGSAVRGQMGRDSDILHYMNNPDRFSIAWISTT